MRFITEVRPEKTFFKDPQFAGLQTTLGNEKMYMYMQVSNKKELNQSEEEILWEKGLLGEDIEKRMWESVWEMTMERVWNCAWEMTMNKKWVCMFKGDNDGDGSVHGR